MQYLKNAELVKLYNISDKTVRNWIESARQGKSRLELYEHNGKFYIVDSLKNDSLLDELVNRSRKYRNQRTHKKLAPKPDFYKIFNSEQIAEIIRNMDAYHEFPQHLRYYGRGARHWDAYLHKLYNAGRSNYLTAQLDMLKYSQAYIDTLLGSRQCINVVDLGVGNGLAVRDLLGHLNKDGRLKKYIGIDGSTDLLNIAEGNINRWFNASIKIQKHCKDLVYDRFGAVLTEDSYGEDASMTTNLVLFLGGTLTNFKEPEHAIKTICDSMGSGDLLISALRLDSERSRRFFDYNAGPEHTPLPLHDKNILELLGIDETLYEVEHFFDARRRYRVMQVKFTSTISIRFEVKNYTKTVEFQKGEILLLCRAWHYTEAEALNLYRKNGFNILQTTRSPDEEYLMLIARTTVDTPVASALSQTEVS